MTADPQNAHLCTRQAPPQRRPSRWWFGWLLALVWGALGYILAESFTLLGVVDYRLLLGTLGDEPWRHPMNRLDPELLHVHHPNQRWTGTMDAGDIAYYLKLPKTQTHPYDVTTDRDGFRNAQNLDRADIAVLGDSYVEGILVPQDETLAPVLGKLMNATAINLGQIWYGPQQEEVVFRRYALPRTPKVVVWCYFEGNDLKDMTRYRQAHAQWKELSPQFHSVMARSLTRNLALRMLGLAGPQRNRPDGAENAGLLPTGETMYFFYRTDGSSPAEAENRPAFEEIIVSVARTCEDQGIRFVFSYVPTKIRVYEKIAQLPANSSFRGIVRPELISKMQDRLRTIAPNAIFVDLTPSLQSAASAGEQTYFLDDTHWTAAGHRAAAQAIAEALNTQK